MPTTDTDGVTLYYETDGSGEPVTFVSEAGLGGWSWGWQHAALTGPYRTIVWDYRGTGRSDNPPGPYALETLVSDLETVLAACDVRSTHLVAAGLGGAVALQAAKTTSRVDSVVLFGSAASGDDYTLAPLFAPPADRSALVTSLESGLSSAFCHENPDVLAGIGDWRAEGDASRSGWEAQMAALSGFDASKWLYEVTQPALVCHGSADELVPIEAGKQLATGLPRGEFLSFEDAGHLVHVERSRAVNDAVVGFLEGIIGDDS